MIDEDVTARLLRLAGPRAEVPADRAARVRRAVHLRWQAGTRRRGIRRRTLAATAFLATVAAFALVVRLTTPREHVVAPAGETVATIERSTVPALLSPHDTVRTGEWLETDATGRAALRLAGGTSVRLDTGSRARLVSPTVIELSRGAVYLDTRGDSQGFEVRTPLGTAYDIGTQFEVRLRDSSLRLRVRTGVVELRRGNQSIPARPGTELTVAAGEVLRATIPAYGPEWEWTASLAPVFEIEGRPLAAFLEHLSREHGWTLRYADSALARDATGIILHGSVTGLQPQEALAVALATSGLAHRFQDEELVVFRTANLK
jgi:hypothetical protein